MTVHVNNAANQQEIYENVDILTDRIIASRDVFIRRRNGEIPANRDLSNHFREQDITRVLSELNVFSLNVMTNTGSWPPAPGEEILPRDYIGQNEFLLPKIPSIKYSNM
jgi:hypothetical protein